ncbi:MAG: nucleotide sugar dehydrogenase [Cyclobacteriaceae bacterium]|nr:nucleotide sugar dehydrogenase [Cyclobacteriaceae bacterium HetDA_MAG_MS6]
MNYRVGVIGLGYVGLPLAVETGKKYPTIGFDINQSRIDELCNGKDSTLEVEPEELALAEKLSFTANIDDLKGCNFYVVTVPTPVDHHKNPDLTPLKKASQAIARVLSPGDIVVYESTVFPGCTEEECVPVLEEFSGLKYNQDFFCGYSPERINPGDKAHRIYDIKKVTSGSNQETAEIVNDFYKSFITAGTHLATSIKVAEAAKVIENAQRDINIAFVNELSMIFNKMDIDTLEVLEAAGTKWNFLPFKPGLVGGHCIGVDPFYLTHKASSLGYHPRVILSGREINDGMGAEVTKRVIKLLAEKKKLTSDCRVLILGFTFKENCPDVRNTRVIDIVEEFRQFGIETDVFDPNADSEATKSEYHIDLLPKIERKYEAIVLAVSHVNFADLNWKQLRVETQVIFDVKGFLPPDLVDGRL